MPNYHITGFEAENIKNLRLIKISPKTGKPIILTGKNGAGKSAIENSIVLAMTNAGLMSPIRNGTSKGKISLKLGAVDEDIEIEIVRTYTRKSERLEITANGAPVKSPQTFLKALYTALTFNPLKGRELDAKEQIEYMKRIAGLDFNGIEKQRKEAYDERTAVNREVKRLRTQLESMPEPAADLPGEEISVSELAKVVQGLMEQQRAHEREERERDDLREDIGRAKAAVLDYESDIEELELEIQELQKRVEVCRNSIAHEQRVIATTESQLDAPPTCPPVDPAELEQAQDAIEQAETTNEAIRANQALMEAREAGQAALGREQAESNALTTTIQTCDETKRNAVAEAKLPLDGIGFEEDCITFNGVPVGDLSQGESIKFWAAVAIHENPKLRVMLIDEASMLDSDGRQTLCQFAQERGYQTWMALVQDEAGGVGIHIEDGSIVAVDGESVQDATTGPELVQDEPEPVAESTGSRRTESPEEAAEEPSEPTEDDGDDEFFCANCEEFRPKRGSVNVSGQVVCAECAPPF